MGSRVWWKKVDIVSQRRATTTCVNFDHDSLDHLKDNFGRLCHDDSYVRPTDVLIEGDVEVPEITQRQLWNALTKLKRTTTGPDNILFWIWKDHAELSHSSNHSSVEFIVINSLMAGSWKRANINPLPKVDFPKADSNYSGLNVTPVTARAFEKVVYHTHASTAVEECLTPTQFAYRQGVTVRMHKYLFNIMFINIWTIKTARQFVSLLWILAKHSIQLTIVYSLQNLSSYR